MGLLELCFETCEKRHVPGKREQVPDMWTLGSLQGDSEMPRQETLQLRPTARTKQKWTGRSRRQKRRRPRQRRSQER